MSDTNDQPDSDDTAKEPGILDRALERMGVWYESVLPMPFPFREPPQGIEPTYHFRVRNNWGADWQVDTSKLTEAEMEEARKALAEVAQDLHRELG